MPLMPSSDRRLRLEPFRAWRFVPGKVSALGAVTSPPYDVLEPELVRRLTEADLHNMVRLILPRDPSLGPRRYDEVAERLQSWQQAGVVVQDPTPALYVYEQRLGTARLCGLVGALHLDPSGQVILPHENVMPWMVEDRYHLMRSTEADLEPILLAFAGSPRTPQAHAGTANGPSAGAVGRPPADTPPAGPRSAGAVGRAIDEALTREPWVEASTDNGTAVHRVWRIDDPATLAAVAADLAGHEALIADGHHRYNAYLHRLSTSAEPAGLAMLVDHDRHPLTLDAIHRTFPGLTLDHAASRRPTDWLVRDGKRPDLPHGIPLTDGRAWLTVYREHTGVIPDVSLLHDELLPAWAVDPDSITYHHALEDALADAGPDQVTAVLDPPTLDQVLSTAARGIRLPRKATSFGPKPRVGLLFRTL